MRAVATRSVVHLLYVVAASVIFILVAPMLRPYELNDMFQIRKVDETLLLL